jgi:hypothetical protein
MRGEAGEDIWPEREPTGTRRGCLSAGRLIGGAVLCGVVTAATVVTVAAAGTGMAVLRRGRNRVGEMTDLDTRRSTMRKAAAHCESPESLSGRDGESSRARRRGEMARERETEVEGKGQ